MKREKIKAMLIKLMKRKSLYNSAELLKTRVSNREKDLGERVRETDKVKVTIE